MRKHTGMTLVELMATLAVGAILITLALPSFQNFTRNNRRAALVSDLVADLNRARGDAITRGQRVVVCRSSTHSAVTPACGGGSGWEIGWVSFVDSDADNTIDAGEQILRAHAAPGFNLTIRGTANVATRVSFQANGSVGAANNGSLIVCDSRGFGPQARIVQVETQGRVSTQIPAAPGTCTPA